MSWPTIAKCYKGINNLTLLHLFSLEEYSFIQELPCSGALWFGFILEGSFAHVSSPDSWGETRVEFITLTNLKKSGETINMAILITDGVGGRDLGMVMAFCHPNQARIEACDTLSALCQFNSLETSVVVVRRYSNTPYIPRRMSHSLYLDIDTLSGGITSTQFPLDRLHLHWLLSLNRTKVLLPCKEGGKFWRHTTSSRDSMGRFSRGTPSVCSNLPISPYATSSSSFGRGHPDWRRTRPSSH